ncbi:Tox-REase-5 domain-containing protein [Achromobacter pulmonis]|nr:Tox-REase-5 domain-containing protein [Achromobacter pulmonis]
MDFDGFISAECLLQEAKGDYDHVMTQQNLLRLSG